MKATGRSESLGRVKLQAGRVLGHNEEQIPARPLIGHLHQVLEGHYACPVAPPNASHQRQQKNRGDRAGGAPLLLSAEGAITYNNNEAADGQHRPGKIPAAT